MAMKVQKILYVVSVCVVIGCVPPQEVKKEEPETEKIEEKGIRPQPGTGMSEAKKYYNFGCEYLKNKMFDEAIKNFKYAIEDSGGFVDAYINLGVAYKCKNEQEETKRVYEKMLKIDPVVGHYALGRLYTDEKKYDEAIAEYKKVIEIDSSCVDAWYGVGYVKEKLGDIKSAIDKYERALKLDPKNNSVRYSLGKTYILNEEYEKGIKELKVLKEAHPEDIDVKRTLGEAFLSIKSYKEASEEFKYIASRLPSDVLGRIELGKSFEGLKDYESATQAYKEAITIDTTNITAYWYLIYLYLELDALNKADEFLGTIKRTSPDKQQVHYLSGTILTKKADKLFEQKEYEGAIANYNKAIEEYKLVFKGEDLNLVDSAKKAIKSTETKLKRAEEEKWWHRH